MYTDRENLASLEQAVTATAVSTDSLLIGARDLGRGRALRAFAQVTETVAAAGAATVNIELIEADDGALTSNVRVLASTGALGKAALPDGTRVLDVSVPTTTKPYLGFRYTVATGPLTAGKFTAGLVSDTESALDNRPAYHTHF